MTRGDIPWGRVRPGSCKPKLYSHNAGSFKILFRSPVGGAAVVSCGRWGFDSGELVVVVDTSVSTDAARVDCVSDDTVLHGLIVGGANAAPLFVDKRNSSAPTENLAIFEGLDRRVWKKSEF